MGYTTSGATEDVLMTVFTLDGTRELVTLIQAAHTLGLTYQQAHGRILSGRLPAQRIDGRWYVEAAALESALEQEQGTAPTSGGEKNPTAREDQSPDDDK